VPGGPPRVAPGAVPGGPPSARRLDDFRGQRREVREGNRTIIREPGRTIIRDGGRLVIRHDETNRLRFGGGNIRTERRGAENFTYVDRPGGIRIITVTDAQGRLIRRVRRDARGRETVLINNTLRNAALIAGAAVVGGIVLLNLRPPTVHIPRDRYIVEADRADRALLFETLMAPPVEAIERDYTLDEIRFNAPLRERMRRVDIDTITFETGSWEITPDQAERLQFIAQAILEAVQANPAEVFLIEGHTDAVGNDVDNLSLSDRRAEAVAQVLTEQFGVPPENLTTQGYGEQQLKVPTDGPERRNRRVAVLRITPLLHSDAGGAAPPPPAPQ
jgi:outer membrane protein OmpA-like peptidoglycan-associated protein